MAVNKVIFGGETVVDLTTDTVTAAKMLSGTTAHDKSGTKVTGTIATKTASDMMVSDATVTAPAGYYASAQSKSVATATQATPSISVDSDGKITASATQSAGYVPAGTTTETKYLTRKAAQTITPGTRDITIASGIYLTGTQTIKGDANLVPENIASGVSIFGVEGTLESGGSTSSFVLRNNSDAVLFVGGYGVDPGTEIKIPYNTEWQDTMVMASRFVEALLVRWTGSFFSEGDWDIVELDREEESYGVECFGGFYAHVLSSGGSWYFRNGSIIEINSL